MPERTKQHLPDIVIYLLAALGIAGAAIWYGIYTADAGKNPELPMDYIWAVASAALVTGYVVWCFRKSRLSLRFWVIYASWLIVHMVLYLWALGKLEKVPLLFVSALVWPEAWLVWLLFARFVGPPETRP